MESSGMNEERNFPNLNGSLTPLQTPAEHQAERLAALPALYKTAHERLCYEIVLAKATGESEDDAFTRHGYTAEQALALLQTPSFASLLDRVAKDMHDNGLTFRAKARSMAEALLESAFEIATDPTQPTAERVKIVQWTAKMAGHEKGLDKDEGKGTGGFSLSITFAGQEPMKVVANESALITQEG